MFRPVLLYVSVVLFCFVLFMGVVFDVFGVVEVVFSCCMVFVFDVWF